MKKLIIYFLLILLPLSIKAQYTVGPVDCDFISLEEAFMVINTYGGDLGDLILQITDNIIETNTAILYESGHDGMTFYNSVIIYPVSSGLTISGDFDGPLIDLDGAANLIIDGRVNQSGNADMVILNPNTGTSATTIRFRGSANNNTIQNCIIKGAGTGSSTGVIFFSTPDDGSTGNNNNIIDLNEITGDGVNRPVNALYSSGTSGFENTGNAITDNKFYDFLKQGASSNGINLGSYNTAWTITGNSFYETAPFTATAANTYNIIQINNTGTGYDVSGNFIGGRAASCGGSAWTKTGNNTAFTGISIGVGTGTASSVQDNTIANINWSNSSAAAWTGILISAGDVNAGTITGNKIGETGSLTITGGATGANVYGINISGTGTVNCQNNIISSVTAANSVSTAATNFYGINKTASAGTTAISSNRVGSTSIPNSINASSISSSNNQFVIGINNTGTGNITITGNTIANVNNSTVRAPGIGAMGKINGIVSSNGINTISDNIIFNLKIATGNTSAGINSSVVGILLSGTSLKNVTGNTIYNLSNTYSSFAGYIMGILFSGSTALNNISENFIHSLSATGATSASASIIGVRTSLGSTNITNNIVSLGGNTTTNLYGIYDQGGSGNNCYLYFNTISIRGTVPSGLTKSYAFYSFSSANTRNLRNNLFINDRSTFGGSNLHYAAYFNSSGGNITCDYNDYFVSAAGGGTLGYYGGPKTTLPIVTGQDASSYAINPAYTIPGSTVASDYTIGMDLIGVDGTGITTDFGAAARNNPTMGAWERVVNKWKGTNSTAWNLATNWTASQVPLTNSNIIFDSAPVRNLNLDADRTVTNITIGTAHNLVTNGHQLTIRGNLLLTGGGQINASAPSSTVVFAGLAPQTVEPGQFVNGKAYNLTIDNALGVTLNDDFTVDNTLVINAARNLTVSAGNQLTVTGTLTNSAGNSGLLLRSDASGDAKLLNNTASVPGTVELYLTGGLVSPGVGRFHYIIPPVASVAIGTTIQDVRTNLGVTNFEGDLLSYSEVVAGPNKNDGWQYFDGYPGQTPVFSSMVSSEGYNIYLTANDRLTFSGQLNGPSHAFNNLSFTSIGFNLVGNPYPANYDLSGITALTTPGDDVDNTVIFNHDGTLAYWNVETKVGTSGYSDIIGPMQGFFVNVTATGRSLSLPASSKTTSAAVPARSKGAYSSYSGNNPVKKIKLVLNNGAVPDEAIVCLIENASMKFDGDYDARKILGSEAIKVFGRGFGSEKVPAIYTVLDTLKYAINSIPVPEESTVVTIPVTLELKSAGTYTIDISEFDNLEDLQVVLKHGDVETRLSEGVSYSFKAAAGINNDFQLIIGQNNSITAVEPLTNTTFSTWYSNSNLYIKCPDDISSGKSLVTIYDLQGKALYSNNQIYIIPGQTIQEAITLPKGVFVTHIVINKKPFISKIVVL